jgi:alkaline phosphatase
MRRESVSRSLGIVVFAHLLCVSLAVLADDQTSANETDSRGREPGSRVAKNIILMISDGCGYNHVMAASLFEHGKTGEQVYEHFPFRAAMSTYHLKSGMPVGYDPSAAWSDPDYATRSFTDSAAAATAMSTGQKTYNGAIGLGPGGQRLVHAWQRAEELGLATGIVTSVQFSHATPAGFVAHNRSRSNYAEIAREIIMDSAVDVVMGCGHPWYDKDGIAVDKPNKFIYVGGEDVWKALVEGTAGGDADGDGQRDPWTLVQTREQFQAMKSGETPNRVCGVAQVYKTLQQDRSGDGKAAPYSVPLLETTPTLAEMSRAALNVLDEDPDGFCVMIEGGGVDWASHDNQSGRMVEEQIDFNRSVEAVVDWVETQSSWAQTLVVVTSDHECGYLTAPASQLEGLDLLTPLPNNGAGSLPDMQFNSGNHTNVLIPIYAKGPGVDALNALADQTDPKRGAYLDNAEIGEFILEMLATSNSR